MHKSIFGYNFWLECPTDLRSTSLSCIFDALFGDTLFGHIFLRVPIWLLVILCVFKCAFKWPAWPQYQSDGTGNLRPLPTTVIMGIVLNVGKLGVGGSALCVCKTLPCVYKTSQLWWIVGTQVTTFRRTNGDTGCYINMFIHKMGGYQIICWCSGSQKLSN